MYQVDLSCRRHDEVSVACPLQRPSRIRGRGQHRSTRIGLVRSIDGPGARHRHCVRIPRAALCGHQVVVATVSVQVRRLRAVELRAGKDELAFARESALTRQVLLQHDAGKEGPIRPVVPDHVDVPLATVIVMEQRRIEATGVQIDRLRPAAIDSRRGRQVVMGVFEIAVEALDVRVQEPEQAVMPTQARRPYATRVWAPEHIEQRRSVQWPAGQLPIPQVPGVVDPDARVPLKGRRRNVVIATNAADRRIRVESAQYGVDDIPGRHAGILLCQLPQVL